MHACTPTPLLCLCKVHNHPRQSTLTNTKTSTLKQIDYRFNIIGSESVLYKEQCTCWNSIYCAPFYLFFHFTFYTAAAVSTAILCIYLLQLTAVRLWTATVESIKKKMGTFACLGAPSFWLEAFSLIHSWVYLVKWRKSSIYRLDFYFKSQIFDWNWKFMFRKIWFRTEN